MPLSRPKKPWLRRQTSRRQSSQVATSISGRDLKLTRPGRDLKVMSRPQIVFPSSQHEFPVTTQDPSVLTSARSRHQKGCRDTNSSSLGRDAKTMSRPRPVWPRLRARCPGRGHALALSWALLRSQPPLPCAPGVLLVTTSKLRRDPVLEIDSSHSSFFFFFFLPCIIFFFFKASSSFPATPRMQ